MHWCRMYFGARREWSVFVYEREEAQREGERVLVAAQRVVVACVHGTPIHSHPLSSHMLFLHQMMASVYPPSGSGLGCDCSEQSGVVEASLTSPGPGTEDWIILPADL